jgi:hypothetical protein
VKWKVAVPTGASSPVIADDRLFLTGFEGGKLFTIAYRLVDGSELWRKEALTEVRRHAEAVVLLNHATRLDPKAREGFNNLGGPTILQDQALVSQFGKQLAIW